MNQDVSARPPPSAAMQGEPRTAYPSMSRLASHWPTIRDVYLPIAAIFLVSRCLLLLVGVLTSAQIASPPVDPPLLSYLCRFDCSWYMSVAQNGYSAIESGQAGATNLGFYPVFPLLVRLLSGLSGADTFHAAVCISNLCCYTALIYVYRYARLLGVNHDAALLSTGLLCVLPQSIVFSAAYSESTFLLLLAVAMFYLRRGNYLAAGIAAALLSATRANGIFFIVFGVAWLIGSVGVRGLFTPWRSPEKIVAIVFAPMGLLVFWGYCFATTGDAFAGPSTMYHGWGWSFSPPWEALPAMLRSDGVAFFSGLTSLGLLAFSLLLLRQRAYAEFVLCAALIVLMMSAAVTGSLFRYGLVLFPVWIALARELAPRPALAALTFSILALLNAMMMSAWTLHKIIAI
jgi:Gpi18-like mannosyltransferase